MEGRNGRQTLDCGCWRDNLMQYRCALHTATPELVAALKEMVEYSACRQANTADRKILAEKFDELGQKYRPLLRELGESPFVEE